MAQTMTPSKISDGQIEKAVADFRASLRKFRGDLNRDAVQWLLGLKNPTHDAALAFRARVKELSSLHKRQVKVSSFEREYQPLEEAARSTGLQLYGGYKSGGPVGFPDFASVEPSPKGTGEEVVLYFFNLPRGHRYIIDDAHLAHEYARRGLKAADPLSLLALQKEEPDFLSNLEKLCGHHCHFAVTHWRNAHDQWCELQFSSKYLVIGRHSYAWHARNKADIEINGGDYSEEITFFAGIRA